VSWQAPNLARDRFANRGPVVRLAAVLALLALGLTSWNVVSYLRAGSGAANATAELQRLGRETDHNRQRLATLERDLASWDLATENRRAEFLNDRFEERTFPWNLLFTRLARAMPAEVRLHALAPHLASRVAAQRAGTTRTRAPMMLRISGEARDSDSILDFLDRLFADPVFDSPTLLREDRKAPHAIEFEITTRYLPDPELDAQSAAGSKLPTDSQTSTGSRPSQPAPPPESRP
jgi:Tfp pilus assembly protein PilN